MQIQHGLQQGDLHLTAQPGLCPPHQAGQKALCQVCSRDGICQRKSQCHRRIRCVAVEECNARHGLCQQILTGLFHPRPLGTIARDCSVNNTGVNHLHRFIIQSHTGHDAGSEIGDHHIRFRYQLLNPLQIRRILQIGRIALLAPVNDLKIDSVAVSHQILQCQLPSGITYAGALNFDDSGSQIAQPHRRRGAGQKLAKIQNGNSFQ